MPMSDRPRRIVVSARTPAARAGLRELVTLAGHEVVDSVPPDQLDDPSADADLLVVELRSDDRELRTLLGGELGHLAAVVLVEDALPRQRGDAPRAWLSSGTPEDALRAAISAVAAGLTVFDPALAAEAEPDDVEPDRAIDPLPITDRERDVLQLLATGLPNKAIGRQLGISEHTVKFHVGSLLSKLEAQSRTEAVAIAAREGLLVL
jgi:DNA-binding NarL/FixJ family response regulator